jgi:hypothetical protein
MLDWLITLFTQPPELMALVGNNVQHQHVEMRWIDV